MVKYIVIFYFRTMRIRIKIYNTKTQQLTESKQINMLTAGKNTNQTIGY